MMHLRLVQSGCHCASGPPILQAALKVQTFESSVSDVYK